jgi:hypothetical protein
VELYNDTFLINTREEEEHCLLLENVLNALIRKRLNLKERNASYSKMKLSSLAKSLRVTDLGCRLVEFVSCQNSLARRA